jgi:hypothetical protein
MGGTGCGLAAASDRMRSCERPLSADELGLTMGRSREMSWTTRPATAADRRTAAVALQGSAGMNHSPLVVAVPINFEGIKARNVGAQLRAAMSRRSVVIADLTLT